jgi:chromate transporter
LNPAALAALAKHFGFVSLLAIGGANVVLPEIYRRVVEVEHWMNDQTFAALFAIGNAAPGPNVMVVTLIGWHVAGLAGAITATVAMCGPSSLLAFALARAWDRFKQRPWRRAVQDGLAPITVGLVAATGYLLVEATHKGWVTILVTAGTTVFALTTRRNPLWAFAVAAAIGASGWA